MNPLLSLLSLVDFFEVGMKMECNKYIIINDFESGNKIKFIQFYFDCSTKYKLYYIGR